MSKNFIGVNISVGIAFLNMLDRWAVWDNRTRSGFVREAVRYYIAHLKEEGYETDKSVSDLRPGGGKKPDLSGTS